MSLRDEPPTDAMLRRALCVFTVEGFGAHKFRYAVRLQPRGIILCEFYEGAWKACDPDIAQQVRRWIDAGLAKAEGQCGARLRTRGAKCYRGMAKHPRSTEGETGDGGQ